MAPRARELLAEQIPLDLSQLEPQDRLNQDLHMDELDSLSIVSFVTALEKEFGIEVPESDAQRLDTVGSIVQ